MQSLNSMVQSEYSLQKKQQFSFLDSQLFEYMGTQAALNQNLSR